MRVDPKTLVSTSALRLRAPGPATGLQHGDRRSRVKGRGVEFADYRPYDPGDDVRLVDWSVYLRHGTALVKQFHEDRTLQVRVCLDVSASMGFGDPSKADHGAQVALGLAMIALGQRDPVSLLCFGGPKPVRARAANRGGIAELVHALGRVEPSGRGDARTQLATELGHARADRLILLSDLLWESEQQEAMLRLMAARCDNPVVVHLLSQAELDPELDADRLVDAETGERLEIKSGAHEAYQHGLKRWLDEIAERCHRLRIRYVRAETQRPVQRLFADELLRAGVVEPAFGGVVR